MREESLPCGLLIDDPLPGETKESLRQRITDLEASLQLEKKRRRKAFNRGYNKAIKELDDTFSIIEGEG